MIYNTLFVLLKKKYYINISFVVFVICCALGLSILSTSNFAINVGDSCITSGPIQNTDFVCTCTVSSSNVNTCKDTETHFCYEGTLVLKRENGNSRGCESGNWCTSGRCENKKCVAAGGTTICKDTETHFCYEGTLVLKRENGDLGGCESGNWCKSGKCENKKCVASGGAITCPPTPNYEVPDCTFACNNIKSPGCPCKCKSNCANTGVVKSGEVCGTSGGAEETYQCFVVRFADSSGNDIIPNQIYGAVEFVDESDSDDMNSYGYGYLTFAADDDDDNTGIGAHVVVKTQPKGYTCSTEKKWVNSVGSVKATNVESARTKCARAYSDPVGKTTITCTKTKQCVNACSSDFCGTDGYLYKCVSLADGCTEKQKQDLPKGGSPGTYGYICDKGGYVCSGNPYTLAGCDSSCEHCKGCTCPEIQNEIVCVKSSTQKIPMDSTCGGKIGIIISSINIEKNDIFGFKLKLTTFTNKAYSGTIAYGCTVFKKGSNSVYEDLPVTYKTNIPQGQSTVYIEKTAGLSNDLRSYSWRVVCSPWKGSADDSGVRISTKEQCFKRVNENGFYNWRKASC